MDREANGMPDFLADREGERGLVIGRIARYLDDDLSDADVRAHGGGYAVVRDVSERELHAGGDVVELEIDDLGRRRQRLGRA
jgi:2-keto-4-pentenoate hydratase/2-oxohepta-3-ene-1,7-dioic acid hydratase in catechol pathway